MSKLKNLTKSKTNFALPPPVPYDPPSIFTRYRRLLLVFILLFFGAIAVARYVIQVERSRPLPLVPVYLQHFKDADTPPKPH